jgi:lipopolysaccharide export system permease protein
MWPNKFYRTAHAPVAKLCPMRIVDKYLVREFLIPTGYCVVAFGIIMIVHDLFDNLPDFVEHRVRFVQVLQYYGIVMPEKFVLVLPLALLLGLLLCLANLSRHNEVLALRAGGFSVLRLAVPYLIIGLLASGAAFWMNEKLVPGAQDRAREFMLHIETKTKLRPMLGGVFYVNPAANREWYADKMDIKTFDMVGVFILETHPDGATKRTIFARQARWQNNQWVFDDVRVLQYDPHSRAAVERFEARATIPEINDQPVRIIRESRSPKELDAASLRRYLRVHRDGPPQRIALYRTYLHSRYAFPWTSLVVMLIGIPCGVGATSRRGSMMAVGNAIMLFFAYWVCMNVALALGKGDKLPAELAAWLPNISFAAVGIYAMFKIR